MSTQDTLTHRQRRYGEFTENSQIAIDIKDIFRKSSNWNELKMAKDQMEALDMIAVKVSRILSGDPDYSDNWHDIQGFAKLVENRLLTGSSYKEPAKKK